MLERIALRAFLIMCEVTPQTAFSNFSSALLHQMYFISLVSQNGWSWPCGAANWLVILWCQRVIYIAESWWTKAGGRSWHDWGWEWSVYSSVGAPVYALGPMDPCFRNWSKRKDAFISSERLAREGLASFIVRSEVTKDTFAKELFRSWRSYNS